ncbi:glycosyltransferase [Methylobacterium sp. R2-1]|uniref:glycosyltransferase n=1 Tax=Methylobacterium sp. R2-1 TaxID=2587064 RepID=UPI00161C242C|nr:glycosyltransferase [Methylobacterium sp. R2-1]MBB2961778.1 GT2 family glycosyltransferase [Methylobacterium sp. R2-1]
MSTEIVTILIPVYNGGYFLTQAIESALAQTWPAIEVLVIDDGSDDDGHTERVCRSFGDRIRYLRRENGGVAAALNTGIAAMTGRYLTWLSHDDLYDPRKVEVQMKALAAQPGPCVIFGGYATMTENGTVLTEIETNTGYRSDQPLWAILEGRINGCTVLLERALLERHGGFDIGMPTTQDYELWWRLAMHYPFVYVPGTLVRHRVHAGQGSLGRRHIEEANLLWMEMLEQVPEEKARSHSGSEMAFLLRARDFLQATGYDSAKQGADALIRRRAAKFPVGIVLSSRGVREAAVAKAELASSGLDLAFLIVDASPDQHLLLLADSLVNESPDEVIGSPIALKDLLARTLAGLDAPILAFLPQSVPVATFWTAIARLLRDPNLDGTAIPQTAAEPGADPLGPLSGLVVRREALSIALTRAVETHSDVISSLGMSSRLDVVAA